MSSRLEPLKISCRPAQPMLPNNLPGRSKTYALRNIWCRKSTVGKLVRGVFLLPIPNGAAAFAFGPSSGTPVNVTTTNVTTPASNIAAGNVAIVPRANVTTSPPRSQTPIQLIVSNNCSETIWPGITTQSGTGPGTGGFELTPGTSRMLFVGADWGGRVWGRTNCSFNGDGSGPSTSSGVNGYGAACLTGDCFGRLDCQFAGQVPTTLAEFTLQGGVSNNQTFYDISLVDGYNLPLAIIYHPSANTSWIPPSLTNCACIATAGYLSPMISSSNHNRNPDPENSTYPTPYEPTQTDPSLLRWCPFDLQKFPPPKPSGGIFPYPDDNIPRPTFQPCLSACSATNDPRDCCTGGYGSPEACKPSLYSTAAKRACPDAYSFAFDDRTSTFVVPSGGEGAGWEVRFCPRGWRSTDILGVFGEELKEISAEGRLSEQGRVRVRDWGYVQARMGRNGVGRVRGRGWAVMGVAAVVVGVVML